MIVYFQNMRKRYIILCTLYYKLFHSIIQNKPSINGVTFFVLWALFCPPREIILRGKCCKIGGNTRLKERGKRERRGQGRYQSMKQWLWCAWEHTTVTTVRLGAHYSRCASNPPSSSLFESNCKIFWVYLLGRYKWGQFRCSPTWDRKLVTPLLYCSTCSCCLEICKRKWNHPQEFKMYIKCYG